ncbi:MAG TPA: AAA domain-containing protein [Actinomycetes bacterium]|nr:AAA domain-containing protein [Actinomycetes bacterium]
MLGPDDREVQRRRDLAIRLFEYLKKLAELRTRPIRDVSEYAETLWFDDIPAEPECHTVTGTPPADPLMWISLDRPRQAPFPAVPAVLAPWVSLQELQDSKADPRLREETDLVTRVRAAEGDEVDRVERHRLDEHPEVLAAWADYRTRWQRWAAEDRRLEPVIAAYAWLFEIEQLAGQLGEQYETVVGVGLLTWSGEAPSVRRHLLTMPAQVRFEAETGRITVGLPPEGGRLRFEEDMLEATRLPSRELVRSLGERLADLGAEPWDRAVIDGALQAWVNAADTRGVYDPTVAPPARGDDFPRVVFAPALILRRRTQRSLIEFYGGVLAQLQSGQAEVPPTIRDIVEILDDGREGADAGEAAEDGEVYFPLPANEEQARIVERLARHRGVVVQGPPGTGKSHTIANLISHLLAVGKRVLVTSHTARALEVVKDKLPEDVASLCVSMVGDGRRGAGDLERSVQALLARAEDSRWEDHAIAERVVRLRQRLRDTAEARRELLARQRLIREREVERRALPYGGYEGTLARIAERLGTEEARYGWLPERPEGPSPLRDAEALELLGLLRTVGEDVEARARQVIPPPTELVPPAEVAVLLEQLATVEAAAAAFTDSRALPAYRSLALATEAQQQELAKAVASLVRACDEALRGREPWLPGAVADVLDGRATEWADLARLTSDGLARLGDDPQRADQVRLQGHETFDPGVLREQARSLIHHLQAGGRIGGLFKAAPVRSAQTMLAQVRVDGLPPDTLGRLTDLLCVLNTEARLSGMERRWGPRLPAGDVMSYSSRAARIRHVASALGVVLRLHMPRAVAERAARAVSGFVPPAWSDAAQVSALQHCLAALDAERAVGRAREAVEAAAQPLRSVALSPAAAPECAEAAQALEARDRSAYARAVAGVHEVDEAREQVRKRDALFERLRDGAPELGRRLESDAHDQAWEGQLAELELAWDWARADAWHRRLVEAGDEREVSELLLAHEERALRLTGELGANLAWRHCLNRMTTDDSQHLRAYELAMRRYGKGTGKQAPANLAEAQRHMDACQGAVPAWIMPTYRVAETIPPRPHAFDVVIVDEASQSGVDALFLLWLAPKIVVVGDDRQISPDNVGMSRDVVVRYRDEYLANVQLRDVLGVDNSLFDQAAARYQGRIWLQEHFRCMPEIIEFSNRLSYPDHRLMPLRQFGTDRLPPLKAVHVPGASVRGTSDQRKVNEEEAQAIVEQIAKCCADPTYDGASMGVVSLLGDAQAQRIRTLLVERIGPEEMVARRIKCGSAYDFQGDERRVMFLSMVVAPTPEGRRLPALGSKASVQRFNVAASRAEDQMWLFHSVQLHDLNPDCVRWKLLNHCLNPPAAQEGEEIGEVRPDILREPFDSLFEQRVYLRLGERGYTVLPQQEVHNFRIDLVVVGERSRLAVECDGEAWHGPEQYARDVARQRDLERCGWRFFRLRESEFYRDPEAALSPLWELLRDRGIWPASRGSHPTPAPLPDPAAGKPSEPAVERMSVIFEEGAVTSDFAWFEPVETHHDGTVIVEPEDGEEFEEQDDLHDLTDDTAWEPEEHITLDPADPPAQVSIRPNLLRLEPYVSWQPTRQPDPRTASQAALIDALTGIVAVEGPVVARRAYRLLLRAAGGQRLGKLTRAPLNRAAAAAVRRGLLADENPSGRQTQIDRVLRLPGTPKVRVRARGDRSLDEVPMSEVAALMVRLRAVDPRVTPDEMKRAVLDAYGPVRMTSGVSLYLESCMALMTFSESS